MYSVWLLGMGFPVRSSFEPEQAVDEFYSQEIQVETGERPGVPRGFTWQGKEYRIQEIWGEWPDYSFGLTLRDRVRWWQRRHRTFFRVVTDGGEVFEIYLDRGGKGKRWILYRRLDSSAKSTKKGG